MGDARVRCERPRGPGRIKSRYRATRGIRAGEDGALDLLCIARFSGCVSDLVEGSHRAVNRRPIWTIH